MVGVPNLALGKSLSTQCQTKTLLSAGWSELNGGSVPTDFPGTNGRVDPIPDFSARPQDLGPLLSSTRKNDLHRRRRLDGLVRGLLCLASFAKGDAGPGCGIGGQESRLARRTQDCTLVHPQSTRIRLGGSADTARGQKHSDARTGTALSSECSPHVLYCCGDDPGLRHPELCTAVLESQLAAASGCAGVQSDGQRGSGNETGSGASSESRKTPAERTGGA